MTADFLITQIEDAFATRKYPWCAALPFEDFCEYVLPYRIADEPLERWRPVYEKRMGPPAAWFALNGESDSAACAYLCRWLMHDPTNVSLSFEGRYDMPPTWYLRVMSQWSVGSCPELVRLGTYAMRSVGLPVAWDYTPKWANRSMGHEWNSLPVGDGVIPFSVKDDRPFGEHLSSRKHDRFAKVYRKMFSLQPESLLLQKDLKEEIPETFRTPYLKDVTELYADCTDVTVELSMPAPSKTHWAYIMTFDNRDWFPIHWGRIDNGKVCFTRMAKENLYMVMYYHNHRFFPAHLPFVLDAQGKMNVLRPRTDSLVTVELRRKYPNYNVEFVLNRMKGGVFQGANRRDFRDQIELYKIDSLEDLVPQTIRLSHQGMFRFFRYVSAPNGFGNMAEIEVYDEHGVPLAGQIIGTEHSTYRKTRETVFDKDPLTYFNAIDSSGSWVGLAFDAPRRLDSLKFIPRTDWNYIEAGDRYELFYYDRNGRVSLGVQTGRESGGVLRYDQVPAHALLLLRNHSRGQEERVFIYENGRQVWL